MNFVIRDKKVSPTEVELVQTDNGVDIVICSSIGDKWHVCGLRNSGKLRLYNMESDVLEKDGVKMSGSYVQVEYE